MHQTPFTPDAFYTKHPLHLPTFTPHLSHQTPFTSSTFYTTPGRQTRVDSSLWPQRTVPKLPSGTNGCQTLKTATLNTFYFCQKRPLCQPPPSPTPPPYSHFVRKVKLRLAYRLAFVIRSSQKNNSLILEPCIDAPALAVGRQKPMGVSQIGGLKTQWFLTRRHFGDSFGGHRFPCILGRAWKEMKRPEQSHNVFLFSKKNSFSLPAPCCWVHRLLRISAMTAPAFPLVQGEEGVTVGEVFVVNMREKPITSSKRKITQKSCSVFWFWLAVC